MRNKGWKWLFVMMLISGLLVLLAGSALAGDNPLRVCTDGDGAAVYAASTGSKKAGILYNGYGAHLSLDDENGRYELTLTGDYSFYVDPEKAENRTPSRSDYGSYDEWEQHMPSGIWLAEITGENTPVYATPKNKKLIATHMKGSLVEVCGEFGDDYYIEDPVIGFVEKSALRKVKDLPYAQLGQGNYGFEDLPEVTVYASETQPVYVPDTASEYSGEPEYFSLLTKNKKTKVLRDLGDWVQLTYGGFIEKRFLDPDGDHSYPTARVKTDGKLDRLIVHNNNAKLVSGTRVYVAAKTKEWAAVFLTGENGGITESGYVKTAYLSFDENEQIRDGGTRVRLKETLQGDEEMKIFPEWRNRKSGGELPAGTLLKVIGVYSSGSSQSDQSDDFLCETEDGRYIRVWGGERLEPLESTGLMATARQAVRMREAPDPEAKVLRQVKTKTKLEVLLRGEIWTTVKYGDEVGYMMSRYLSFP